MSDPLESTQLAQRSDHAERIRRIVEDVRGIAEEERDRILDEACRDDAERLEVEVVLARLQDGVTRGVTGFDFEQLLDRTAEGDPLASDRFWAFVFDDLKLIARGLLARENRHDLPETVSLVLRAVEKILDADRLPSKNRAYFFGSVKLAMKRIIIDAIRRPQPVDGSDLLKEIRDRTGTDDFTLEDLKDALERLKSFSPRQADVVWMRFIIGLSVTETAKALDVSQRTVESDWALGRAWLHRELSRNGGRFERV